MRRGRKHTYLLQLLCCYSLISSLLSRACSDATLIGNDNSLADAPDQSIAHQNLTSAPNQSNHSSPHKSDRSILAESAASHTEPPSDRNPSDLSATKQSDQTILATSANHRSSSTFYLKSEPGFFFELSWSSSTSGCTDSYKSTAPSFLYPSDDTETTPWKRAIFCDVKDGSRAPGLLLHLGGKRISIFINVENSMIRKNFSTHSNLPSVSGRRKTAESKGIAGPRRMYYTRRKKIGGKFVGRSMIDASPGRGLEERLGYLDTSMRRNKGRRRKGQFITENKGSEVHRNNGDFAGPFLGEKDNTLNKISQLDPSSSSSSSSSAAAASGRRRRTRKDLQGRSQIHPMTKQSLEFDPSGCGKSGVRSFEDDPSRNGRILQELTDHPPAESPVSTDKESVLAMEIAIPLAFVVLIAVAFSVFTVWRRKKATEGKWQLNKKEKEKEKKAEKKSSVVVTLLKRNMGTFQEKRRRRRRRKNSLNEEDETMLETLASSGLPPRFTYAEITEATKGFSKKLGEGGYGAVYEGTFPQTGAKVAVKVFLDTKSLACRKGFCAEVMSIGERRHRNLVPLCGFCAEDEHRMLVYELMANGSLNKALFGDGRRGEGEGNGDGGGEEEGNGDGRRGEEGGNGEGRRGEEEEGNGDGRRGEEEGNGDGRRGEEEGNGDGGGEEEGNGDGRRGEEGGNGDGRRGEEGGNGDGRRGEEGGNGDGRRGEEEGNGDGGGEEEGNGDGGGGEKAAVLSWERRHAIAMDTARALAFLHEGDGGRRLVVVHCDVKPENILLDERWRARVSDFGLAKLLEASAPSPSPSPSPAEGVGEEGGGGGGGGGGEDDGGRQVSHASGRGEAVSHASGQGAAVSHLSGHGKASFLKGLLRGGLGLGLGSAGGVRGTFGYLAPEWMSPGAAVGPEADVYSFGIVLLELLAGRRALVRGRPFLPGLAFDILRASCGQCERGGAGSKEENKDREELGDDDREQQQQQLPQQQQQKQQHQQQSDLADLLDPRLRSRSSTTKSPSASSSLLDSARGLAKIALWCLQDDPALRPPMAAVLDMLARLPSPPVPGPPVCDYFAGSSHFFDDESPTAFTVASSAASADVASYSAKPASSSADASATTRRWSSSTSRFTDSWQISILSPR